MKEKKKKGQEILSRQGRLYWLLKGEDEGGQE